MTTPHRGQFTHPAHNWPQPYGWLRCTTCTASWVGVPDEPCQWCLRRLNNWNGPQ